ncbi:MAG: serine/threonine protein kinase, partial [Bacteroidota bacterium]
KISRSTSLVDLQDVITYAIQTAEGLQAAHKKGITHRDIKSSNIMVTTEGQVKIMDFGLAKTTGATMLTKSGATVGTVPYMSPEQALGEKVDHRTDIWSLGVVLYEMISGRLPFESPYSEAIVYSILNEEPKPFSLVRNDVPEEVENIVKKCLQKNPASRYQHADELIVDLRRAKAALGKEEPRQKGPSVTRLQWRNWYLIGVASLVIAIMLVVFLPRFKTTDEVIRSIAVLPLDNLSRDPEQEYFADGMTEALITDLAKISSLRVISRTSVMHYKTNRKTVPEIAKELNVDAIVEGSVQRSGDRVRITAQLLHAPTDRHLWAESYERNMTDVLALQSEIARTIANEIHAKLTPQEESRLASAPPVNKEAYEHFLKGRFYWNLRTTEGTRRAIEHFEAAKRSDPNFAPAYAGLVETYPFYTDPIAVRSGVIENAKVAFEIDSALSDSRLAMALVKMYYEWDWP